MTRDGEERLVDRSSGKDSWHRRVVLGVRGVRFALRRVPVVVGCNVIMWLPVRRKDGRLAKKPGPKPAKKKRDVPHRARAAIDSRHPVHVVMKIDRNVVKLRTRKAYQVVRQALRGCAVRPDYPWSTSAIQERCSR